MASEIIVNQVVTTSGFTPAFAADSFSSITANVMLSAVGGTTPSFVFQLQSCPDNTSQNWFPVGAPSSALTANGGTTLTSGGADSFDGVLARVAYTVTGTTPTANIEIWMDGKP